MAEKVEVKKIDLADLQKGRRDMIQVELGGEPFDLWFDWNPNGMTMAKKAQIDKEAEGQPEEVWIPQTVAYFLTDWNLESGGEKLPTTVDSMIGAIPFQWVMRMAAIMFESLRPNLKTESG